jgi:hypothetical protein
MLSIWRVTSTTLRLCRLNVLLLPIDSGGESGGVGVKSRLPVL